MCTFIKIHRNCIITIFWTFYFFQDFNTLTIPIPAYLLAYLWTTFLKDHTLQSDTVKEKLDVVNTFYPCFGTYHSSSSIPSPKGASAGLRPKSVVLLYHQICWHTFTESPYLLYVNTRQPYHIELAVSQLSIFSGLILRLSLLSLSHE